MPNSALLKVDRAATHVGELTELLRKRRPFTFVVQTNTQSCDRSAFTKKDEAVIGQLAIICGDAIHNLRSALDHIYWEIVSPHCTNDKERRDVQFPFTSKANELRKTLLDKYAERAGTGFFCALLQLKPHDEPGGSEMLSLVREADNLDKHRLLIPAADYAKVDGSVWTASVPDVRGFDMGSGTTLVLGNTTINWKDCNVPPGMLGKSVPPTVHLYERETALPLEVVLKIGGRERVYPIVSTLNQMVDAVRDAVTVLREASRSY